MAETVTRAPSGALAARVRAGSGVNVYACYQCTKCSTGCPVAAFADVHPAQVIRAVQLGDEAMSLDSRFIWLCTGCEMCTTRCPVGVDVASVVAELRILARHDGRVRRDMPFARMLDLNYRSFRRWGRLYEIELVVLDLLGRPRAALDAVRLGLRMLPKGKVRPLPGIGDRKQMRRMSRTAERIEARRRAEIRCPATETEPGSGVVSGGAGGGVVSTLAYYPGCSLHSTAREMDSSFAATMAALDVDLAEIPGWQCCGNSAGRSVNRLLAAALPAGELVKVRDDMELGAVAVPCAACFNRFQGANHAVATPAVAADVAEVVGRPYDGGVKVLNMVDVYHDHVGLEQLRARVVEPFRGLRVACYYGCLLTRPPKVTLAEDPEYPVHMDEVVRAIGCAPVDWDGKTDCCGAGLALCEQGVVDRLVARIVANARRRGADAIVCACPLCQINLDGRQREIRRKDRGWTEMPIVFLSQMVGRALGVSDERLGLRRAMVDPRRVLAQGR